MNIVNPGPQIGERAEGAGRTVTVIASRPIADDEWVVLAAIVGSPTPYVTWHATALEDGTWNFFWGHYFHGSIAEAAKDFEERS